MKQVYIPYYICVCIYIFEDCRTIYICSVYYYGIEGKCAQLYIGRINFLHVKKYEMFFYIKTQTNNSILKLQLVLDYRI